MRQFSKVVSLNYDLLVYWAILLYNSHTPSHFKDCFFDNKFDHDCNAATIVYYPHGNLALGTNLLGEEFKITAGVGSGLLETIFSSWRSGGITPLFVSEGTSKHKKAAIDSSPYLSYVYEEVLPELGENIVVLGWSMGDQDDHLLDAVCQGNVRRFAVAADPALKPPDMDAFQAGVRRKLGDHIGARPFDLIFLIAQVQVVGLIHSINLVYLILEYQVSI